MNHIPDNDTMFLNMFLNRELRTIEDVLKSNLPEETRMRDMMIHLGLAKQYGQRMLDACRERDNAIKFLNEELEKLRSEKSPEVKAAIETILLAFGEGEPDW